MIKQTVISAFLFLYLFSCDTKQNSIQQEDKPIPTAKNIDTVINNDLTKATDFYNNFYIKNEERVKDSKIDSLNYHFDSLQIRLWNIEGLFPNHQLYIITRTNSIWTGTYYNLRPDTNYITGRGSNEFLKGPLPLEIKSIRKVKPKLSWTKFIDSLISLNIMTLPDMDNVPKMKVTWTDSGSTIIEVSTQNTFRFYRYSAPGQFADKFWQASKVASIQTLFNTELSY